MIVPDRLRLTAAGLLAAALVLGAAACSSTSDQVSDKIAEAAGKQLDLPDDPDVTCPDDAKAEKGESFTCTLAVEDETIKVDVKFTDDTHFESTPRSRVFQKADLTKGITDYLTAQQVEVTKVTCPGDKLVVIDEEGTTDCTAEASDGTKATVKMELDDSGTAQVKEVVPL